MRAMRLVTFAFASLFLACSPSVESSTSDASTTSDSSSTSDSVVSDVSVADFCAQTEARIIKCEAGTFDKVKCANQLACYQTLVRPEDKAPFLSCLANRACGVSDDKCVAEVAMKYTTDPTVSAYVKACAEKRTACSGSFADDFCAYDHGLFTDEYRAKMKACVDKPCAEIGPCFDTIITAAGCK